MSASRARAIFAISHWKICVSISPFVLAKLRHPLATHFRSLRDPLFGSVNLQRNVCETLKKMERIPQSFPLGFFFQIVDSLSYFYRGIARASAISKRHTTNDLVEALRVYQCVYPRCNLFPHSYSRVTCEDHRAWNAARGPPNKRVDLSSRRGFYSSLSS